MGVHWDDYNTAAGYDQMYNALDLIMDDQDYYCGSDSGDLDTNAEGVEMTMDYDDLSGVCGMYYISWTCTDWAGNTDDADMYVLTLDTLDPEIYYGSYFALATQGNTIALFVGGCALVAALVALSSRTLSAAATARSKQPFFLMASLAAREILR